MPADLRLIETSNLECDESVLTGEAAAAEKTTEAIQQSESPLDLPSVAVMGTIVHEGGGRGIVVQTGPRTAFGRIAAWSHHRPVATLFHDHAG